MVGFTKIINKTHILGFAPNACGHCRLKSKRADQMQDPSRLIVIDGTF